MKRFFKERPIFGGLVVIVLAALFCYALPIVLAIPVFKFIIIPLNPGMSREEIAPLITQFATVVTPMCAIICAAIFARKIRKYGYTAR